MRSVAKWPVLPLAEAFWFQEGPGVRNWQFTTSGIKLLNVANIEKDGTLNLEKTDRHLDESEVEKKYSHFLIDAGDLVIASSGISFDYDGLLRTRGAFVRRDQLPLCLNTSTIRFKAIDGVSDLRFLRFWLDSREFRTQITKLVTGTAQQNFGPSHLKATKISLPTLPEQRRIAEILDKADALRAKRRAALAQLDTLTQSIFLDMFGDPRKNDKNWSKAKIETVISDVRGGAALEPEDFVEEGFPILHKGAIKPGGKISIDSKKKTFATLEYVQANQRSLVNREFIAVTLRDLVPSGPSIGLAADLRKGPFDGYLLAQGAYAFRLDSRKLTEEYFVQLSNMPNFRHLLRQNAVGSTQIHIRTPVYLAITIPLPPVELQREFSKRVWAAEQVGHAQLSSQHELDGLFSSLQHRAFRGELVSEGRLANTA
jgi:type I restriction enzyme S subunit